ncbi:hypothetical protein LshimejAT787_0109030 [Lyophyllum shimeji]|uniref:Integrase catalytic domain-containing protein n=1 Tax=Lyophyllum shimeji TaxID=47721 RepID=A0A9P3PEI0_LYOSH|nr:hypothetical protein LshimejAT787_0109030 [Lyophyllum shimeji]
MPPPHMYYPHAGGVPQSVPYYFAPPPPAPAPTSHPVPAPAPSAHPSPTPPTHPLPIPTTVTSHDRDDKLPSTVHIPVLTGKHDWGPWSTAVSVLLQNLDLTSHICDAPTPGTPYDPSLIPTYPPTVTQTSTPDELNAWRAWWRRDGAACHVLLSRLSGLIQSSLPGYGQVFGVKRSARDIFAKLRGLYGVGDWTSAQVIKTRLRGLAPGPHRILDYIMSWRNGINQLDSAGFPWDLRDGLSTFLDRFPPTTHHLVELSVYRRLLKGPDVSLPSYNDVFDELYDLEVDHQRLHPRIRPPLPNAIPPRPPTVTASHPSPSAPPSSLPMPSHTAQPSAIPASRPPRPAYPNPPQPSNANNPGWRPHSGPPGGGHQRAPQAHLADGIEQSPDPAPEHDTDYNNPGFDPDPPLLDTTPPSVYAGISVVPSINNMIFDAYAEGPICFNAMSTPFAKFKADIDAVAFATHMQQYNSLLDTGCSGHIFTDRRAFWSYDTAAATPVLTANCGSLPTLARGEVRLRVTCTDGKIIILRFRDCLHAPSCPINLLSVGAMTERGIEFDWRPGPHTFIRFPHDHPLFPGSTFLADVVRRLSFLRCEFVYPDAPPEPAVSPPTPSSLPTPFAAPVFERVRETPELWHRRLGHIGLDATRAVLTKDYATGVKWDGKFEHSHCIPCLIGKYPQRPYTHNRHRASKVCELIHIDTCGPFPVSTPQKKRYFFSMLDDCSNWGVTDLMAHKNEAFLIYKSTEAAWELQSGNPVRAVRCDGAKEFILGKFAAHLRARGIQQQITAEYAHQQNGKIERYIRTLEDGAQTLLADARLPPSFLGDAILTYQYLLNRTPTSTLPHDMTPYEVFHHAKPDLSHLRVWGCQCFVAIPPELRQKGGPRRFEAIFVGYTDGREGWRVRGLDGRYHFTRDAIFNESTPGHLAPHRGPTFPDPPPLPSYLPPSPRPRRTVRLTEKGQAFADAVQARAERTARLRASRMTAPADELADPPPHAEDFGGVCVTDPSADTDSADGGVEDATQTIEPSAVVTLTPSMLHDFVSFVTAEHFILPDIAFSLDDHETASIATYCMGAVDTNSRFYATRNFNLNKAPESQREAYARPDADVWRAAERRELDSLAEKHVFEESALPKGRNAIGLVWVYAYKYNPDGSIIKGKEKARLCAQGFSQRPDDFGETYAPVAKLTSIRIVMAYANHHDLELMSFDVKTAFLHAGLSTEIYTKQIPGHPLPSSSSVLRLLRALYGLRQSAYEFYMLLWKVLVSLGLTRCEVDHGVFFGRWTSSPHPDIPMPADGTDLVLIIPVHVDDGLAATNSLPLYAWFLVELQKHLDVVDMGPTQLYLGIRIIRDRSQRKLWLSQKAYILDLLQTWKMDECSPLSVPLRTKLSALPPAPSNACPDVTDDDLTNTYQRLVGSLIYLAVCARPDIAYAAMALGKYNSKPTRAHMLAAKGVLRYLKGTMDFALEYGSTADTQPDTVRAFVNHGCGFSDADWASDELDRKSISGYCFFYHNALVSWSAVGQRTISLSSTESEYYALAHAMKEALWIRLFLTIVSFPVPKPFPLLCDNQAAGCIASSLATTSRSKHIDIRYHFIREHIASGDFATSWISTQEMTADIMTKPLLSELFQKHRTRLQLVPL